VQMSKTTKSKKAPKGSKSSKTKSSKGKSSKSKSKQSSKSASKDGSGSMSSFDPEYDTPISGRYKGYKRLGVALTPYTAQLRFENGGIFGVCRSANDAIANIVGYYNASRKEFQWTETYPDQSTQVTRGTFAGIGNSLKGQWSHMSFGGDFHADPDLDAPTKEERITMWGALRNSPDFVNRVIKGSFLHADTNLNKSLDVAEFAKAFERVCFATGIPLLVAEIPVIYATLDKNSDGKITKDEFQELVLATLNAFAIATLRQRQPPPPAPYGYPPQQPYQQHQPGYQPAPYGDGAH